MASTVDILIVEDTPDDAALLLRALRRHQLTARVAVAQDGPEALEFLCGTGAHADRRSDDYPRFGVSANLLHCTDSRSDTANHYHEVPQAC
jgi:CheY-like chemotaxis protein